tara:strand:+ start:849 stop:1151 length:303 start_codon:yes stop_codon:yes gene_type:complete
MTCSSFASDACTFIASLSCTIRGCDKSSVVVLLATALVLNKLNMADDESTNVTSILQLDPESFDTNKDLITAVLADGTVYSVVKSVVVKSTFLFIKLFGH